MDRDVCVAGTDLGRRRRKVEGLQRALPGGTLRPLLREASQRIVGPVVEAPHTWVCPVVVVERSIFLHEEDHMIDCSKIAPGRAHCCRRETPGAGDPACGETATPAKAEPAAEEVSSSDL